MLYLSNGGEKDKINEKNDENWKNELSIIIPAAGKGSRFYPLTNPKFGIPKECLPIWYYKDENNYNEKNNGTPILKAILNTLSNISKDFYIVINDEKEEKIRNCLKDFEDSMNIKYVKQKYEGDAGAIYSALKENDKKYSLVHYGDIFYDSAGDRNLKELKEVSRNFIDGEEMIALFLAKKEYHDPSRYGVFKVELTKNDSKIKYYDVSDIIEKPNSFESNTYKITKNDEKYWLINSGIFFLNNGKFLYVFEKEKALKNPNIKKGDEYINTKLIRESMIKYGEKIKVYESENPIIDIGTFKEFINYWS